uniref:Uncharacterized protein n=1 Tax=Oryza punctata TaxID=4537 RepID=A0A0E0LMS9_ORYPU
MINNLIFHQRSPKRYIKFVSLQTDFVYAFYIPHPINLEFLQSSTKILTNRFFFNCLQTDFVKVYKPFPILKYGLSEPSSRFIPFLAHSPISGVRWRRLSPPPLTVARRRGQPSYSPLAAPSPPAAARRPAPRPSRCPSARPNLRLLPHAPPSHPGAAGVAPSLDSVRRPGLSEKNDTQGVDSNEYG